MNFWDCYFRGKMEVFDPDAGECCERVVSCRLWKVFRRGLWYTPIVVFVLCFGSHGNATELAGALLSWTGFFFGVVIAATSNLTTLFVTGDFLELAKRCDDKHSSYVYEWQVSIFHILLFSLVLFVVGSGVFLGDLFEIEVVCLWRYSVFNVDGILKFVLLWLLILALDEAWSLVNLVQKTMIYSGRINLLQGTSRK